MLKQLIALEKAAPEQLLYHYTKCSGVQRIVAGQMLHATKSDFLNDVSEIESIHTVMERILETVEPLEWREKLDEAFLDMAKAHAGKAYYVVSFSTNPDSITLWSELCDSTGYNIAFRGGAMTRRLQCLQPIAWHGYVVYEPEHQETILRKLIFEQIPEQLGMSFTEIMEKSIKQPKSILFGKYCDAIHKAITVYALFFKQKEFAAEAEYRFAIKQEPDMEIRYREKDGFIVPYIRINLHEKKKLLPIDSITIAPKNHTDLAQRGMQIYLKQFDYDVPVHTSRIKLRY